jgi:hypothetical protein
MPSLFEPAQKLRFIADSMQNAINAQFCDLNVEGPRAALLGGRVGVWCLTRSASITPMIRKPGLLIRRGLSPKLPLNWTLRASWGRIPRRSHGFPCCRRVAALVASNGG